MMMMTAPPPISFEDATFLSTVMSDDSGSSSSGESPELYHYDEHPYYFDTPPSDELSPQEDETQQQQQQGQSSKDGATLTNPPSKKRKHTKKSGPSTTTQQQQPQAGQLIGFMPTFQQLPQQPGVAFPMVSSINNPTTTTTRIAVPTAAAPAPASPTATAAAAAMLSMTHNNVPAGPQKMVMITGGVIVNIASEDDLLKLDSEQIEGLLMERRGTKDANFTLEDEKRIRKVRRLIKNREYAQQSRNKKKQYLGGIEKELEMAKAEARALRDQVSVLSAKVTELERENGQLKDLLGGGNGNSTVTTSAGNAVNNSTTGVSVSACLLSVLVLGLVISQIMLPFFGVGRTGLSVFSGASGANNNGAMMTGRTLKSSSSGYVPSTDATANVVLSGEAALDYWQWQEALLEKEAISKHPSGHLVDNAFDKYYNTRELCLNNTSTSMPSLLSI